MHSKMFNCSLVLRDNFQSAKIKDWCREYQKALDIFKILQDHAIQLLYLYSITLITLCWSFQKALLLGEN